ncbi:MAG: phosphatase PAP2 family protein [Ilumatobacteraceae bacterium]
MTDHELAATWPIHRRQAVQLVVGYLVLVAVWVGLGLAITGPLESTFIGTDEDIAEWFEARRTPTWNTLSLWGSHLAETWVKVLVTSIVVIAMVRVWRRWFEAVVVAVALIIEAAAFLAITLIVRRDRPAVVHLDGSPIGSSFPSGHVAAAVAYAAIAVVVFWHTRKRLARTLAVVVCVVVPILVGVARMYRGMHFLTDVIAGSVLGGACVILTVVVLRRTPEADAALTAERIEPIAPPPATPAASAP